MSDKIDIAEALSAIDDRHLQRYFDVNEERERKSAASARIRPIALAAACICVLFGTAALVFFAFHSQSTDGPEFPSAAPGTVGETDIQNEKTTDRDDPGEKTPDRGLIIAPDADDPQAAIKIVVKTEKAAVKAGEALRATLYAVIGSEADDRQEILPTNVTARITTSSARVDPWFNRETVREIDNEASKAYTWHGSYERLRAEEITVPAEVFTVKEATDGKTGEKFSENEGAIVWFLEVHKEFPSGEAEDETTGAALYYRIVGEDVFLYATQYDFRNDVRASERTD